MYYGTMASKINVTPKGVRLSDKLQPSVMKFDRSNKFDLCYYGQVNKRCKTFCIVINNVLSIVINIQNTTIFEPVILTSFFTLVL